MNIIQGLLIKKNLKSYKSKEERRSQFIRKQPLLNLRIFEFRNDCSVINKFYAANVLIAAIEVENPADAWFGTGKPFNN